MRMLLCISVIFALICGWTTDVIKCKKKLNLSEHVLSFPTKVLAISKILFNSFLYVLTKMFQILL